MLDTLIRGAKIVDGTGKAAFTADVGILDGMIEAVGNLSGAQAFETIEAAGRVLTPGFIDMHRHADAALFREGFGEAELCQGLTTLVNGNCGMSLAPLSGAHADECAKYLAPITGNIPPELRFASIDSYFKAAQGRGTAALVRGTHRHGHAAHACRGLHDGRFVTARAARSALSHGSGAGRRRVRRVARPWLRAGDLLLDRRAHPRARAAAPERRAPSVST